MSNDNSNSSFVYVWCRIICTVTCLWVIRRRNGSSIPGTDDRFSSASKVPHSHRTSHGLVFFGYGWLFPRGGGGGKAAEG